MSTKSFLEKYRWEWEVNDHGNDMWVIYGPGQFDAPIAEAYSADDAQKIVDALNRVPVAGPVEDNRVELLVRLYGED